MPHYQNWSRTFNTFILRLEITKFDLTAELFGKSYNNYDKLQINMMLWKLHVIAWSLTEKNLIQDMLPST